MITADEKPLPEAERNPGPNQEQLPHVSEEAATTGKITGEGGPEVEQGTPVQEVCWPIAITSIIANSFMKVLKRDEKAQQNAPKVLRDDAESSAPKGTRSYSTSARRLTQTQAIINLGPAELEPSGQIYGLPELPLPSTSHIKHRYDPIIKQVTNLLMRDGKLSVAQRVRSSVPLFFSDHSEIS